MFAGFTERLNFGSGQVGTFSTPSAFPTRPIAQLGNFNLFATNFLNATGITDSTIQQAINQLSNDLVNSGLMNKMIAVYPFVGGNSTTHAYNLKDPRNTNSAFRLTFFGGGTHSSTGYQPNGTNGYANTFLNAQTNLPQSNSHLSFYSRTTTTSFNQYDISADDTVSQFLSIVSGYLHFNGFTNFAAFYNTTNSARAYWIGSKTSPSQRFGFRNGVLDTSIQTGFNDSALPNSTVFIGASNGAGSPRSYSTRECAFATIGLGLTQLECATLYTIVQIFQTTLGRQV